MIKADRRSGEVGGSPRAGYCAIAQGSGGLGTAAYEGKNYDKYGKG